MKLFDDDAEPTPIETSVNTQKISNETVDLLTVKTIKRHLSRLPHLFQSFP